MNKNKTVPELRFPEFKNKGEWESKKLGEVAEFLKGKNISKADICDNGQIACIRYGELYTVYNEVINEVVSFTDLPQETLVFSKANDVIIPASGETQIDIAKASCVSLSNIALGGDLNIIRSSANGVFLSYYLNHPLKYNIAKLAQGNAVVHLYNDQLKSLRLSIPTKPQEQQKIATCLSSLDEVIARHEEKLLTLQDHKKGLMQNLFPKEGETKPKYRFPEFKNAEEWEEKKLGEIGKLVNGLTYSPNDVVEEGTLVLRSSNVKNSRIELSDNVFVSLEVNKKNLSRIGDILICIRNGSKNLIGKNALIKEKLMNATHGAFMTVFRTKEFSFVYQLFQSKLYYKQVHADLGATINSINGKNLLNYKFYVPKNKEEQQKIADCLSSIDNLIEAEATRIEQLKQHKQGLMQGLFPKIEE